jgi:hypothetical protein
MEREIKGIDGKRKEGRRERERRGVEVKERDRVKGR